MFLGLFLFLNRLRLSCSTFYLILPSGGHLENYMEQWGEDAEGGGGKRPNKGWMRNCLTGRRYRWKVVQQIKMMKKIAVFTDVPLSYP